MLNLSDSIAYVLSRDISLDPLEEISQLKVYITELEDTLKYENVLQVFSRTRVTDVANILKKAIWIREDLGQHDLDVIRDIGIKLTCDSEHLKTVRHNPELNSNIERPLIQYLLKK